MTSLANNASELRMWRGSMPGGSMIKIICVIGQIFSSSSTILLTSTGLAQCVVIDFLQRGRGCRRQVIAVRARLLHRFRPHRRYPERERLLHRFGGHAHAVELPVFAAEAKLLLVEAAPDDLQPFVHARPTLLHRHAEGGVVSGVRAGTDRQVE